MKNGLNVTLIKNEKTLLINKYIYIKYLIFTILFELIKFNLFK